MVFPISPWRALVLFLSFAVVLTGCGGGGGGGGGGKTGKPTDPPEPGQTSTVLTLALEAIVPPRDVVAADGQPARFAVELGAAHGGTKNSGTKTRFQWSLDGAGLDLDGSEIEIATGELAAGTHQVSVLLTEDKAQASLSWKLQVTKSLLENRPPAILQALPPGGVSVQRGDVLRLSIAAADVDAGDALEYFWLIDGVPAPGTSRSIQIDTSTLDPGEHVVRVVVSDGLVHSGETPAEHSWSVSVGESKDAARPYLTAAWPLGSLRLPTRSIARFEVEAAGPGASSSGSGEDPVFRWEVNGRVQASRDPVFELDTTSDENALGSGAYRITCAIEETLAPESVESASVGWTVYLDQGSSSFEPMDSTDTSNEPPFAESIFPSAPVHLFPGESESFMINAKDPDGDVLSYQWLVDGALQITDGPVLTYTAPAALGEGAIKVEVFASDGHSRAGDEEFLAGPRLGVWEVDVDPIFSRSLALTVGSLVLDNGATGTAAAGSWSPSGAAGAYGADSLYSKSAGATYTYTLQVPVAGSYDVLIWWTSWPSRVAAVPIVVQHKNGSATVNVDQRVNGGQWNKIGTFDFSGSAKVVITSTGGDVSTCADAVCLSPVAGSPPPPNPPPTHAAGVEFVIDDGTPGTSSQGTWSPSSAPNPYGGKSLYAKGSGGYTFSGLLAAAGTYDVYAWWTEWASRDPAAPYSIVHSSGTATVKMDQRQGGGKWNLLGRYSFGSRVEVRVAVPGTASVSADAVRFVPATSGSPPPAQGEIVLDNGGPGTSATGTWSPSSAPNPYGAGSLYARGSGSYTYQAALPSAGTYGVYVWYTQWPSRSSAVPYEIRHASGTAIITVDQRSGGGQWELLGDFAFGATANITVRVVDANTVCADAVRLVPRSPGSPPPSSGLTLAWDPPTKNADGSSLGDLAGYRVYSAAGGGQMSLLADVGLNREYKVVGLTPGTYKFAVTAYDSGRNESQFSSTLSVTVP